MSIKEVNEKTSVPFKVVVPIVSSLIIGTWVISAKLAAIESKLDQQWTTAQQERWSNKLRAQNPSLTVPYVEEVASRGHNN